MATGSKSARMTLAEGLAFLTSAMSWIGPGPGQGRAKVADRGGLGRLGLQLLQRHSPPRRGDLAALRSDDLVEYGHPHRSLRPISPNAPGLGSGPPPISLPCHAQP